jgi:hypothetical protein
LPALQSFLVLWCGSLFSIDPQHFLFDGKDDGYFVTAAFFLPGTKDRICEEIELYFEEARE